MSESVVAGFVHLFVHVLRDIDSKHLQAAIIDLRMISDNVELINLNLENL